MIRYKPNTRLSRPRKLNPDLLQLGTQPTLWQGVSRPIRDLFAELVHPLVQDPPSFLTYSEYGQSKKVSDFGDKRVQLTSCLSRRVRWVLHLTSWW